MRAYKIERTTKEWNYILAALSHGSRSKSVLVLREDIRNMLRYDDNHVREEHMRVDLPSRVEKA